MTWALGLSRFIHGSPTYDEPPRRFAAPDGYRRIDAERQARLLPALIATLFDVDSRLGAWPPTGVDSLLDWADGACAQRRLREALLLDGLAALDEGLLRACNVRFEVLSPVLRRHVLDAFARGELGLGAEAAQRFMDGFVQAGAFALLNFELALVPLPDAEAHGAGHA